MELQDLRKDYGKGSIQDDIVSGDPIDWFRTWLDEALDVSVNEANAMVLSTVSDSGMPSSRVVLLKLFDQRGFQFFTNYESRKGLELASNPKASLLFFWPELERQVRIQGTVTRSADQDSDDYFYSRPVESRVSAVISPQSRPIPNREYLEKIHSHYLVTHSPDLIKRPSNWGGFLLVPHRIEFWQGRQNRLHDRIEFERKENAWKRQRLAP